MANKQKVEHLIHAVKITALRLAPRKYGANCTEINLLFRCYLLFI